jgi:hypothetical protein
MVVVPLAADPIGPGRSPHERPLVLGETVRPAVGEVLGVVRVLFQDGADLGLLVVGELPPREAGDDHMALGVPGEGRGRQRSQYDEDSELLQGNNLSEPA